MIESLTDDQIVEAITNISPYLKEFGYIGKELMFSGI